MTMLCTIEPITVLSAISLVLFDVYGLALSIYGIIRTGFTAFLILIAVFVIGLCVSIANVALVCDSYIGIRLLGATGWMIFYYVFVCVQPVGALLTAIALTMLTLRTLRKSSDQLRPGNGP
jgi:hypothetical protein